MAGVHRRPAAAASRSAPAFACPSVRSALIAARDNLDATDDGAARRGDLRRLAGRRTAAVRRGAARGRGSTRRPSIDANGVVARPRAARRRDGVVAGLTIDGYALSRQRRQHPQRGRPDAARGARHRRDRGQRGRRHRQPGRDLTVEREPDRRQQRGLRRRRDRQRRRRQPEPADGPRLDARRQGREHAGGGILTRGNAGNVTRARARHVQPEHRRTRSTSPTRRPSRPTARSYTINARRHLRLHAQADRPRLQRRLGQHVRVHRHRQPAQHRPARLRRSLSNHGGQTDVFTIAAGEPGRGPRRPLRVHARPARPPRVAAATRPPATPAPTRSRSSPTRTRRRRPLRRPLPPPPPVADAGADRDAHAHAPTPVANQSVAAEPVQRHGAGQGPAAAPVRPAHERRRRSSTAPRSTRARAASRSPRCRARRRRRRRSSSTASSSSVQTGGVTDAARSPRRSTARSRRASAARRSPRRASCGATARASSAPRATTPPPPSAARSGSSRTPARPR